MDAIKPTSRGTRPDAYFDIAVTGNRLSILIENDFKLFDAIVASCAE